jgi:lipid II:glycine glycyltransferase (peptidoglycan interpeptide bridge formation enzyme)
MAGGALPAGDSSAVQGLRSRDGAAGAIAELDDRARWNALVLALGDGADLRQGHEWGELRRRAGWRPHRHAILVAGVPIAAVSLLSRRLPGLEASVLYASRGPVLARDDESTWQLALEAVRDLAQRTDAIALRVSPPGHADDSLAQAALRDAGFVALRDDWTLWNAPRIVMRLDLRPDERELQRRMRPSTRRALGRAAARGVLMSRSTTPEAMVRFHRLLVNAARRRIRPVQSLRVFESLRRHYLAEGDGCLLLASHQDGDLAGLLAVRFGRRAYLLYSAIDAASPHTRTARPGTALHWELIRWARDAGCDTLDWGGSGTSWPPRRNDPGFGVYDFKLGFGCRLEALMPYHDLVLRPGLYRAFRAVERTVLPLAWGVRARVNR